MTKDALIIQYQDLEEQLRGINPKLELYKKIEKKLHEVKAQLGGLSVDARKTQDVYVSQSGNKRYFNKCQRV